MRNKPIRPERAINRHIKEGTPMIRIVSDSSTLYTKAEAEAIGIDIAMLSTLTHQRGKTTRKSLMVLDFRVVSCG